MKDKNQKKRGFSSTRLPENGLNRARTSAYGKNQCIVNRMVTVCVCGLVMIATILTSCSDKKGAFQSLVPVITAQSVVQPEPLSLTAVGTVEPIETVAIRAQVGGVIEQANFSEGDDVRAGQLLFQIDPRPFKVALDVAQALLAKDQSQAQNAEIQAKRYADLLQKDFVTQEQYDAARTQAEMWKSAIKGDEAAAEQAKLNLSYASIVAPISGRTGSLLVKKGNVIRANDAILVVINQMHPIRVSFAIPGTLLPTVQKYAAQGKMEVHVVPSRNGDVGEVTGRLSFLDNAVDASTGTITMKAEFVNEEGSLWPGQFVDVELVLTVEQDALTVPASAVVTGQEGTFVYMVGPDKKVEKRPVTVNRTLADLIVIEKGLIAGETIVTDGQMRLIPGALVEIKTSLSDQGRKR